MCEYAGRQDDGVIFDEFHSTLDEFVVTYDDRSEYPLGLKLCEAGVLLDLQWLGDEAVRVLARQVRWDLQDSRLLHRMPDARATTGLAQKLVRTLESELGVTTSGHSPAIINAETLSVAEKLSDFNVLDRSRTSPFAADVGFHAADWSGDWNGLFNHLNIYGAESRCRTSLEGYLLSRGAELRASSSIGENRYCSIYEVDNALFIEGIESIAAD